MPVPPQPANPIIRQHQVVLDQINLLLICARLRVTLTGDSSTILLYMCTRPTHPSPTNT